MGDVDFAPSFIDACRSIGFVAITGHSIPVEMFDAMRDALVQLFALDERVKTEWMITRDNYRGFIPLGFFSPNRPDLSGEQSDQYEGYKLHWECPVDHPVRRHCAIYGPNRWVDDAPGVRGTVESYWRACDELSTELLDIIADELDVSQDTMRGWHQTPLTNMTLLHYPAQRPSSDSTAFHAHKDTNVITLLHPDPVGGLEVRDVNGGWIDVSAPPEALLVNIGEMLELWSGGRLPATAHRVVNRTGRPRSSFPYFVVPNHDITVEPLMAPIAGFSRKPMHVGELSAEVWRTNWPDAEPADGIHDLGTLDR